MVRRRQAKRAATIALLAIPMLLGGCKFWQADEHDIIGVWVESEGLQCGGDQPCARFEFFADGSFQAENVPPEFFWAEMRQRRLHKAGTWELREPNEFLGNASLEFHFQPNMGVTLPVVWGLRGFTIESFCYCREGELFFDMVKGR